MFKRKGKYICNGLTPFSKEEEKKILVVFVHGLGGSNKTWDSFVDQLRAIKELLPYVDVAIYCYPTSYYWVIFRRFPDLSLVAEGLKTFIQVQCKDYQKIVLVGHSMGGVISRKYLIDEIMHEKRDLRVKSLLLYASPINGAQLANIVSSLGELTPQISQLKNRGNEFIKELERCWESFGLENKLDVQYIVAGRDRIVDQHSARSKWGGVSVHVDIDKSHRGIIKARRADDLSLNILVNEVKKILSDSEKDDDIERGIDEDDLIKDN